MPSSPATFGAAPKPAQAARLYDRDRGSASSRGYDRTWQKFRRFILTQRPMCQDCQPEGYVTAACEVHHVIKLTDRPDLRLDPDNVLALCTPCHSRRTGRGE